MNEYTIRFTNGSSTFLGAKSFRVDKNGTLVIIGKRFTTFAAYPAGYWESITQHA